MFGTSSLTLSVPETAKYLMEIKRNSIGLDEWFKRFDTAYESHTNYPPYNLIKESSIDFRLENYIFQPVNEILLGDGREPVYSEDFLKRFYIGSASTVFHSPLGPVSLSLNYYDQREEPWSWIINFGYLIFNKRALD